MVISAEEAISLLKKWLNERTPVKVFWVSHESILQAKVSGFVNGLSAGEGLLIGSAPELESKTPPEHFFLIDVDRTQTYEYVETKDLKEHPLEVREYFAVQHGIANLSIRFEDGSRLSIFERAR